MKYDIQHILCSCHSADHTFRLIHDGEDVYLEVQLHKTKNVWERLIASLKYLFGYECKYGHWDIAIVNKQEITKLYYFLKKYKNEI